MPSLVVDEGDTSIVTIEESPVEVDSLSPVAVSSDDEEGNEVEVVSVKNQSLLLLANPKLESRTSAKTLAAVECPICFDTITTATITLCGHIFCLECVYQSILSSSARGQARHGKGLCPLCRENVTFKDTTVLRMKKLARLDPPELPQLKRGGEEIIIGGKRHHP